MLVALEHRRDRRDAAPAAACCSLSGALARRALARCAAAAAHAPRAAARCARLSAAAREIERDRRRRPAAARPATTETRSAELAETLNRMLARARARARLRERRFLADASHELRTPVTSLAGNVDFVGAPRRRPGGARRPAARRAAARRLVDDLLALERESAGRRRRARCGWTRSCARRPRRAAARRASARDRPGDGPRRARRAAPRARQPARERRVVHGPEGDAVSRLADYASGATAALAVRDDGTRAGPADLEHAFERFWRGARREGRAGSGLGLAIAASIATGTAGGSPSTARRSRSSCPRGRSTRAFIFTSPSPRSFAPRCGSRHGD